MTVADSSVSILKPIELLNIGYVGKEASYLNCPSCERVALSVVRLEAVTCLQRALELTEWWKNWEGRYDINHYCGKCGCYIGRFVDVNCMERCVSRQARRKAAYGAMKLRTVPVHCAERMQKARERALANLAKERQEKQKQQETQDEQSTIEVSGKGKDEVIVGRTLAVDESVANTNAQRVTDD